ncbi:MAG: hypothetical protein DRP96_00950 [Candidatus Neomarinimicrobiota bacterium]|nr:MAG: hypothetical protein DRP96_00950 [Candidatus Neomarinimicrobiota bacterium]
MIVPMHKVTLFISAPHQDEALVELRKLGVLHVQHVRPPQSEDISELESALNSVEKCRQILDNTEKPVNLQEITDIKAEDIVSEVLSLIAEKQQIVSRIDEKNTLLEWFETWGKVSAGDIEALQAKGIYLRLYDIERNLLSSIPEDGFAEILHEEKNQLKIALISESEKV